MMKRILSRLGLVAVTLAGSAVFAQASGPLGTVNVGDSLTRIFGTASAFSVTMKMEATDAASKKTMRCVMPSAYLNGQSRSEIDLTKLSTGGAEDEAMKAMAAFGIDKMIAIYQPRTNSTVQLFPGLKSYCEMAPGAAAAKGPAAKEEKVEVVEIGKETVDGHPCIKKQVKREGAPADEQVFFWAATDLKNMPVKATFKGADGVAVMTFSNYNFTKPDAALFTVPAGYKKYNSMQELMMGAMQNMMPGK